MILRAEQIQARLGEIKTATVAARRANDEETAKQLSAEKAALKKRMRPRCVDCGEPCRGERCMMHANQYRNRGTKLGDSGKPIRTVSDRRSDRDRRTIRVASLLAKGRTVKQAAEELCIDYTTAAKHRARLNAIAA